MAEHDTASRHRHQPCTDPVVGAILSGWRYDISGIVPELRGDYEDHLRSCRHCLRRQRLHRAVDLLLIMAFSLTTVAFLLAAVIVHRLQAMNRMMELHLHVLPENAAAHSHIPATVAVSLETVAVSGVVVSVLLWVLVAIATPVPGILSEMRHRASGDRLQKRAA